MSTGEPLTVTLHFTSAEAAVDASFVVEIRDAARAAPAPHRDRGRRVGARRAGRDGRGVVPLRGVPVPRRRLRQSRWASSTGPGASSTTGRRGRPRIEVMNPTKAQRPGRRPGPRCTVVTEAGRATARPPATVSPPAAAGATRGADDLEATHLLPGQGDDRDRRGGPAPAQLRRPAPAGRARARRAVPPVLAHGRPRRQHRGGARGRRVDQLHRPGRPGRPRRSRAGRWSSGPSGRPASGTWDGSPQQINQFATRHQPHAAGARRPGPLPPRPVRRPTGAGRPGHRDGLGPRARTPGGWPRRWPRSGGARGRVLHAAAADGWLVRQLADRGRRRLRRGAPARAASTVPRWRASTSGRSRCSTTCGRSPRRRWARSMLSGVVDGMAPAERDTIVALVAHAIAPGGSPRGALAVGAGLASDEAPLEADLASGTAAAAPDLGGAARPGRVRGRGDSTGRVGSTTWWWRWPTGGRRAPARPDEGRLRHPPLRPRPPSAAPSRPSGCWPSTWPPSPASRSPPTPPAALDHLTWENELAGRHEPN